MGNLEIRDTEKRILQPHLPYICTNPLVLCHSWPVMRKGLRHCVRRNYLLSVNELLPTTSADRPITEEWTVNDEQMVIKNLPAFWRDIFSGCHKILLLLKSEDVKLLMHCDSERRRVEHAEQLLKESEAYSTAREGRRCPSTTVESFLFHVQGVSLFKAMTTLESLKRNLSHGVTNPLLPT